MTDLLPQECQSKAWREYHKCECGCLANLRILGMHRPDDAKPVYLTIYRYLIRLLKLYEHKKLSLFQRRELESCVFNEKALQEDARSYLAARFIAKRVINITGIDYGEDQILRLMSIVSSSLQSFGYDF
jgi:hypothetical protein